jgi:hypothetical protein
MPRMIRKQIYIVQEQERQLKKRAEELKTTEANLVREAIDVILARPAVKKDPASWEKEWKFINTLLKRRPVKGKRTWKREDIYER